MPCLPSISGLSTSHVPSQRRHSKLSRATSPNPAPGRVQTPLGYFIRPSHCYFPRESLFCILVDSTPQFPASACCTSGATGSYPPSSSLSSATWTVQLSTPHNVQLLTSHPSPFKDLRAVSHIWTIPASVYIAVSFQHIPQPPHVCIIRPYPLLHPQILVLQQPCLVVPSLPDLHLSTNPCPRPATVPSCDPLVFAAQSVRCHSLIGHLPKAAHEWA